MTHDDEAEDHAVPLVRRQRRAGDRPLSLDIQGRADHRDDSLRRCRPGPKGSVLVATFEIAGQQFIALNGGPYFKFNEAISLSIDCKSQSDVDEFWAALSRGGAESRCGWLKDKFGLSWQIVPSRLPELLRHPDPDTANRVMRAMMQMVKLDIAKLEAAAEGR